MLLLLLSHFSCVQLCATPQTEAHQEPLSLGFSRQELEWVAISFSNAWKWKVKGKSLSSVWLLATPWTAANQAPPSMVFSRQEYWSGVPLPSPLSITHIQKLNISSVQFSCSDLSNCLSPHGLYHARPPCPSPAPRVDSNSCPLSRWCHPMTSFSVVHFFSHLQSFPASGCFKMNQFFTSSGQIIGVSASASVIPMNIQDWFPLGWTDWISLQSKGLSRVFSNTTVQKHQFFGAQLSLQSIKQGNSSSRK